MSTSHLEPLLARVERCAILTVLRRHPEWTLGHVCELLEHSNARTLLLRELTLGELYEVPVGVSGRLGPAVDGGPPIDRQRLAAAAKRTGERFDACVRGVLDDAAGVPVSAGYLRARVGGPRWKLQASLQRLVDAGVVVRSGSTSGTRYWIARACEGSGL